MWFSWLAALWLAAFAWGAVNRDEEGNVKSITLRTHSLSPPYLDSDMQSRWYEFGGDAVVRTDQYIRLAADRPSQMGYLWSRVPLTATNWELEVEFKIHGNNNLFGDGFAMWLTKSRMQAGPVFGAPDNFEGLGVFVDTYKNNRPGTVFPYVMAMMGDGQTPYDKQFDGKKNELAGCSARGLRHPSVPSKLRLTYFQDKYMRLELQYKKEDEWIECFDIESPPVIPPGSFLGFSSETGELSDNHDIISISAKNLYSTSPEARAKGKNRYTPPSKKKSGSWTWFFGKVFLGILAVGGCYMGYTMWRANQKRAQHRF